MLSFPQYILVRMEKNAYQVRKTQTNLEQRPGPNTSLWWIEGVILWIEGWSPSSKWWIEGDSGKNRLPPVAWHLIELLKSLGGLGIGSIHQKNLALLAKWIWRFLSEPHPLWRKLVQEKYHYGHLFSILDLEVPKHGGPWKAICAALFSNPQAKALLMAKIRKKIGNGKDSYFWHDCWLGDHPLKIICPRLFRLSSAKNSHVAFFCLWDGLKWKWAFE